MVENRRMCSSVRIITQSINDRKHSVGKRSCPGAFFSMPRAGERLTTIITGGIRSIMTGLKSIEVETFHYQPHMVKEKKQKNILRVAAYARVSTLKEDQNDSFETQCNYYEKLISGDPHMVLAGVYGDQGVSGLSTKSRTEFMRMMQDCRDGKIDFVITRSVSRLSRNMTECLEIVQKLMELGIPVRFEKEGLTSTDPGSEMFFHVLATLAQEESGSLSRKITWALERRAEIGEPARKCPYGYKREGKKTKDTTQGSWLVNETEAKRIRKAFEMAADLCSYEDILNELNRMEKEEGTQTEWCQDRLYRMLRSEIYRGDVLTHKTYTVDYIAKKRAYNRGERTQYYITGHHAPLVPIEMYERVQSLMDAGLLHSSYHNARYKYEKKVRRWRKEEAKRQIMPTVPESTKQERSRTNIVQVAGLRG